MALEGSQKPGDHVSASNHLEPTGNRKSESKYIFILFGADSGPASYDLWANFNWQPLNRFGATSY